MRMFKKLGFWLIALLLLQNFPSFSFSKAIDTIPPNLYLITLKEFFRNTPKDQLIRMRKEFKPLYIFETLGVTDSIPTKLSGVNLKVIYNEKLAKSYNFPMLRIFPIEVEANGTLLVNIASLGVSWRDHEWKWVYSGGYSCEFKFNCTTKIYDLVKSENVRY